MRNLGPVLADSWRLFKPYFFQSEEKRFALTMLVGLFLLAVVQTELGVLMTFWSNLLFDTFQRKDLQTFLDLMLTWQRLPSGWIMPGLPILVAGLIVGACLNIFVTQYLQIRWRNWMTGNFLRRWLSDRAYYRISIAYEAEGIATDNPDQRISDDLAAFCGAGANTRPGQDTLSFALGFVTNVVSLLSYVVLLWFLSRNVAFFGLHVPGALVWVALLFSIGGTVLTYAVGRQLIPLRFFQQRYEADFRFGLVRTRENTEGIALNGGEAEEQIGLLERFTAIRVNFIGLLRRVLILNLATISYNQIAFVLPYVLIAPVFFSGKATLGTMIQIQQAFGQVQGAFSWFADNFPDLASWRATVGRLATFDRAVEAARSPQLGGFARSNGAGVDYRVNDLSVSLPNGTPLASHLSATFTRGVDTLISGRSGAGKSTLFRVLAGIWPFGSGRIEKPDGSRLFLPQRPYIPLGTLRHAVCYPLAALAVPAGTAEAALADADLSHLEPFLDQEDENWVLRLSGGEQQRLAIARALVVRPDWLFLDEATASLDPETEGRMYAVLKRRLPGTTIISIAHNPAVAAFHKRRLVLDSAAGTLVAAE